MIIRTMKVTNRIEETGVTNDFVSHIDTIIECKNNIALLMDKYTLVINKRGNYHKIIPNRFKKESDFDYDKVTCSVERLTWFYPSFDKYCHSDLSTYRLLGIVQRLLDDNGITFTTYCGYEVNHKLPRIYKNFNNVTNLEVCSDKENKRHYLAWMKCQVYEDLIPLQLSALGGTCTFILNKGTEVVNKTDNSFTLRNYNYNGEVVEMTCKLNTDRLWRFNG